MSNPSPWRPRLVQEGKPLYGGDGNDHSMDEAEQRPPPHTEHAAAPTRHHQPSAGMPSSLARAAGGSLSIRPPRISTKLVVENESTSNDDVMAESPPRSHHSLPTALMKATTQPLQMRLVVGGETQNQHQHVTQPQHLADYYDEPIERMEGVEHHGPKGPLVVIDGANVAYAYADAMLGFQHDNSRTEPDARGIQVAADYFLAMDVRVLVVIPAPWFRAKPRPGDESQGNAMMITPQLEVLKDLKARGLLVAAPPRDDDDAYALTIARREDARSHNRGGGGGGFVLSCDLFRDAVNRDITGELREWLTTGSGNGPGRISFAFCDMGSTDDYGDKMMDFVANPRHPLVAWIEEELRRRNNSHTR